MVIENLVKAEGFNDKLQVFRYKTIYIYMYSKIMNFEGINKTSETSYVFNRRYLCLKVRII